MALDVTLRGSLEFKGIQSGNGRGLYDQRARTPKVTVPIAHAVVGEPSVNHVSGPRAWSYVKPVTCSRRIFRHIPERYGHIRSNRYKNFSTMPLLSERLTDGLRKLGQFVQLFWKDGPIETSLKVRHSRCYHDSPFRAAAEEPMLYCGIHSAGSCHEEATAQWQLSFACQRIPIPR